MIRREGKKNLRDALRSVEKGDVAIIEKDVNGYHVLGVPKKFGTPDCRELYENFLRIQSNKANSYYFMGHNSSENCAGCQKREKCQEERLRKAS